MPGAPTIKTGLNTFEPLNWTITPDGKLIGCNGVDRGIIHDGRAAAAYDLGIDAPQNGPAVTAGSGGNSQAGDYVCAFRWVDAEGVGSSLSPLTVVSATANQKFSWASLPSPGNTRITHTELYRSTAGQTTALYRVAKIPVATTSFANDVLGDEPLGNEPNATAGVIGNLSASADASGFTIFTTAATHPLYVGAVVSIRNHSVDQYNRVIHTITAVSDNTHFTTDAVYVSNGTGGQWTLQNVALFNGVSGSEDDGYRFEPPPDFKSVPIYYQDRLWLGIDVVYDAGTATFTATSREVTGSTSPVDTNWTAQMVGRWIYPKGGTRGYRIIRVVNKNTLTIETAAVATVTTGAYAIRPEPSVEDEFYWSEVGEPESMRQTNVVRVQRRTGDSDRWTAMKDVASALFLFKERSIYKLTYVRQPEIDVNVSLFAARGCLNQRCTDLAEGNLYAMDQAGPFRLDGNGLDDSIAGPVASLFREGRIDFSLQKQFHVRADPIEGVVRFHVAFVGDSSIDLESYGVSGPGRALCFNWRLNVWWQEDYLWPIRCSVLMDFGNRWRRFGGSHLERIYLMNQGTLDGTTAPNGAVTGTVVSVDLVNGTFDVSANTPTDCNGATIALITGAGKGQIRRLHDTEGGQGGQTLKLRTGGAWSIQPAPGDVYVIGAVLWKLRTGIMSLIVDGERSEAGVGVTFQPTATPTELDARVFLNHDTQPQEMRVSGSDGDGVRYEAGSPNVIMDMRAARDPHATAPGYEYFGVGGHGDAGAQPDRFVSVELRGLQALSQVIIHAIELNGAREDT